MIGGAGSRFVAIVDDDRSLQRALKDLMESAGLAARCYGSAEEFLESDLCDQTGCLVLDILMPGMSGLELQAKLNALGSRIPIIFITARGNAKLRTRTNSAASGTRRCGRACASSSRPAFQAMRTSRRR